MIPHPVVWLTGKLDAFLSFFYEIRVGISFLKRYRFPENCFVTCAFRLLGLAFIKVTKFGPPCMLMVFLHDLMMSTFMKKFSQKRNYSFFFSKKEKNEWISLGRKERLIETSKKIPKRGKSIHATKNDPHCAKEDLLLRLAQSLVMYIVRCVIVSVKLVAKHNMNIMHSIDNIRYCF